MNGLLDDIKLSIVEGLQSRTLTSCSRWASKRRIMGGDFPGPYSWKYHPWVRELHDSWAPENYAMKSAQMGVTEVGLNRAFYTLDILKRDVLYLLPTSLIAGDFSRARFGSAIALSPYLQAMFTDTNTVSLKQAGSNVLYIRGSRGESNLVSIPVSEIILDEVDRMSTSAIGMAKQRQTGQLQKHLWGISTPTVHNKGIHALFLNSTQEHFTFECPHCGRSTELVWPDCIEIIGDHISDPRVNESYLKCKECKHKLEQKDKPQFLGTGKWVSMAPNASQDIRGFHINQLYSFTVTAADLVRAYFAGLRDERDAQVFNCEKLGMPFIGEGAQITEDQVVTSMGRHSAHEGERPTMGGKRLITMGVDQGKWSYVSVVEWFIDTFGADINSSAQAKLLWYGKFIEDDWGKLDELMREWQILACVIDADPQINEARRFARRFPGYAYLCRYRRGQQAREIQLTEEETGAPMATVDRTNWLTATLSRFKSKPARIVLPADISLEYREHIKALVRRYEDDENGNPIATFVSTGPDHYAHSLNYAEIALPLAASITSGQDVGKFL
jgi:hypothetical protein